MPFDPSALPLLLAGPILRRVESDLVSVWLATSRACNAALWLYDGGDIVASEDSTDDPRAKWVSTLQPTLQIGAHLHVLTVVLDLRTPDGNAARSGGATLEANRTFSYDLQLFERANPAAPHTLRSLGLLDGEAPLGYDPEELPAFRTCPQELDRLILVHGSCRHLFVVPPVEDDPALDESPFVPPPDWPRERPTADAPRHDGPPYPFPPEDYPQLPKRDGMLWIDALIDARGPTPIVQRPHQLFLTGDQIYADQPPSAVLPALTTLARVLIGEEELGADPAGTVFRAATLANFPPFFRGDTVRRTAAFTTSDGESHLLSFGEFVAYYLLTWSPALWELDLWPSLDDFDPATIEPPADWIVRFIYKSEPVDEDSRSEDNLTDAYKALRDALPVDDHIRPSPPREGEGITPEVHADWYFRQVRDWVASKYWSPALFEWWTRRFRRGLPRVRRALANVPTYMVADDHDISDDWYFSRQWREQVFTRPLGVDIVRNGLMACSLMQAWGNDPRRWATGPERELLTRIAEYAPAMAVAASTPQPFPREVLNRLHELLGLPQTIALSPTPSTFRPLVEYSYQIEGPCHRVLAIDGRTKRRFPFRTSQAGGIDYEGATGLIGEELPTGLPGEEALGLFGDSPMAAALPPRPAGDTKMTIVITGVPVIGPEGMELTLVPFQRFARLLSSVDAESWSYEPSTYEALLAAMARYESVVILSGDVHIGWSAALDYWSAPDGGEVRTARIVQLVSSGLTKDWGSYAPALRGHALSLDIFESATTPVQKHAERVGWGTPLRTALTPPPVPGPLVTQAERAHPFYRARLKMKAPVVPTHGWPQGTTEAREPNWAWRATMAHDDRPESTQPPTVDRRWTPVELPVNPIDPSAIGWHSHVARRMAFGRVFNAAANVGIVSFEPAGAAWSVRHIIAGELAPLADTGVVPTGLQPYVVHRLSLAPPAPSTWLDDRPRIVDDGGWGVDTTEPVVSLILDSLPRIWQGAADFGGAVYEDLPPITDEITREALITDAASRVSGPFRRRVLRELGPYALLPDAALDALPDTIDERFPQLGRWNAGKEARALVRPDLERLLAMRTTSDPATMFDDILLLGCSEWVNDRVRIVSMIAGILVTFRSPVTKHVPVLAGLLAGLWDLWRNRTFAETFKNDPSRGLLSLVPRAAVFGFRLVLELLNHVIQDHETRPHGGPPIFTPELAVAGLGVWQGQVSNPRFTFASGWELPQRPPEPGARALARTPESLARQTVTMIVHPGGRQRFTTPARNVSLTMIPPPPPEADAPPHGSLLVGWDGGLETEEEIAGGVKVRLELDGRGYHQFLWGGSRNIEGRAGGTFRITVLRPTLVDLIPGADIKITPAVSLAIGVRSGVEENSYRPAFTFRVALNDIEDRVTFLPDDDLLQQLLPADGLAVPVDGAFEWTLDRGWRFAGFGEAASGVLVDPEAPQQEPPRTTAGDFDEPPNASPTPATEVVTPINKRLGALTFHERRLEVTTASDSNGASFNLSVTATVSVNVGPVRIAVSGLGLRWTLHLASEFESVDDLIDFSLAVPMPTGLAVSVDTDAVSGGGFLQRIEAPTGVVTWRGGLALRLGDRYDVSAWGIVQTGGGQPYTFLAFLAVRFSPPINLTVGLKLVALGGLVALNRTMDVDALRDAAMGTQGTLDPILFPDRPEQRFLELIPAVERFFPPAPGHQVVGLLAEIEWRAETGTTFGRFRLALLGELEDLKFGLYGTAQFGFPKVDDAHILRIRASAEALYDHKGKFARFSLTLTEALLFERVHLTGGAALLIRWGDRNEFAMTLGGFHPSFRPFIPQGLREPPRLGAFWKPHSLVELSIKAYFALTSTSLQFGFAAHVEAGASWGGFRADTEFNFLVMTEPDVRFELDLSFRVTVFLFGCDLISASLKGAIAGPGPWSFEGSVYWEVCGVDISKDFGPYHWGDSPPALATQQQEARRVLAEGLGDVTNWTVRRNPRLAVRLRPGSDDALDPRDQIDIRQTRLPLGVGLEVHDANGLSDAGVWTLAPATGGLARIADLTDTFPTRRYLKKPPKETPFRGGLTSGVRVGGQGWAFPADLTIESDESTTEDLVLDSIPTPPQRVIGGIRVRLADAVLVAAPAQSPERKWTRHTLRLNEVA